jgi:hypothetical protein
MPINKVIRAGFGPPQPAPREAMMWRAGKSNADNCCDFYEACTRPVNGD